jgi:hypothetical protein
MRVTTLGGLSLGAVHSRALGATEELLAEQMQSMGKQPPTFPSTGPTAPAPTTRTSGQRVTTQITAPTNGGVSSPGVGWWVFAIGGAALGVGAVLWLTGAMR